MLTWTESLIAGSLTDWPTLIVSFERLLHLGPQNNCYLIVFLHGLPFGAAFWAGGF
jgi:hypothetical protein